MDPQTAKLRTPGKQTTSDSATKVRVVVRVRPFLAQEIAAKNGNPRSCISVIDQDTENREQVAIYLKDPDTSRNEYYQLDSFFEQRDDNVSQIFYKEVDPLIPGLFHGCNATVFAYGATGSGKTYTMQGSDEFPGLIPLAMSKVLSMCPNTGSVVEMSYSEVYMDRCYDLLEVKLSEIAILDDKDGRIHLKGLSQVRVSSISEFRDVFSSGVQRRKVAHTGLNDVSSRSHGVLVISVSTPCCNGSGAVRTGKLNLIDLAGNEDNRRTCNEGIRLKESAKINQSLFALSNVIFALNNNKARIPYRESKLTRILQDSLGGTSRALMVACLNPGEYQESVHTVSLAARSRHVSNFISSAQKVETPQVKVDMEAKLQAWLESKGKKKSARKIGAFPSPFLGRTPSSIVKKINYNSSSKVNLSAKEATSNAKQRESSTASRTLFKDEGTEKPTEKTASGFGSSPPIKETKGTAQSPLRKVLSPVNSNGNRNHGNELPCKDQLCSSQNEPTTPCIQNIGTPLHKFNALSSNLKNCLMQEYIQFLNTASREELLELKGIGVKLTEYILELRETSPLKSLHDLEKLGLSSKQVYNTFSRAAKGIFETLSIHNA